MRSEAEVFIAAVKNKITASSRKKREMRFILGAIANFLLKLYFGYFPLFSIFYLKKWDSREVEHVRYDICGKRFN